VPLVSAHRPSRLALLVGTVWSICGLVLLWPLALGTTSLAHHHVSRGILLLTGAIGARGVLSVVMNMVIDGATGRARRSYRIALMESLSASLPSDDVVSSLVWASERASGTIALDALRAGAGMAILNLPLIFWFGGWQSASIVLVLVCIAIPFYQRAGAIARDADTVFRRQRNDLTDRQLELLHNSLELRALGAIDYGADTIGALSEREHRSALTAIRASLGSSLVTEFLGGVSVGLVAMVVGFGLLRGREHVTAALISVFATADLIGWIRRYGVAFHQREAVREAVDLLHATQTTRFEPAGTALLTTRMLRTTDHHAPVSLDIQPGDHIAVVGPSGSGKTTLVSTLLGVRLPFEGRIQRTTTPIGRVAIESQLLGDTVRTNLALTRSVEDSALTTALAEVGLSLELNRRLSADGEGLSTGERLRLLVARALVQEVGLIVLDDVAGALDRESSDRVREALRRRPTLAVIECAVDAPSFISPIRTVVMQ